jgi:hypothetical protein
MVKRKGDNIAKRGEREKGKGRRIVGVQDGDEKKSRLKRDNKYEKKQQI